MKVAIFIKRDDGREYTAGDIVEILPAVKTQFGKHDLNKHIVVYSDINIPCGYQFAIRNFNCNKCEDRSPDLCDYRKYMRGLFVGDAVKPVSSYRYNIDYTKFISTDSMESINVNEKTISSFDSITASAEKNPQPNTIITEKKA